MGYSGSKIRLVLIFLSFLYSAIYGTNVTVDADGGAAYPSLDSLLKYYQATGSVILPDTITFTGNDIDTFFMTEYLAEAEVPTGGVLFRGLNLNPDSFPVIIHNKQGTTHYNLLLMKVSFERIVFTGTVPFRSDASNYGITFRKCIFRGFNDTSCIIFGATGSAVNVFENCLFVNNTVSSGLIHLNTYNVGRKINFVNCTFDNNAKVFKRTDGPDSTVTFKNSVFSGNGTIFTSDTMKSKATYCLTSETSLSGYGTGCRSGDPQYVVAAARAKPSDWKVMMNAPADTLGHITGAPTDDIAGRVRRTATPVGAGCWRADVPSKPQITDQPDTVVVNEDSTVTFSVAVTGSGVSYGWYKTGAATKLSDSAKFIKTAAFSDSGAEYYCIFSNAGGADTSKHALLNVLKKPAITKNISDTAALVGDTLKLFISATGSQITYQWYLNEVAITGATKDTLVFNGLSAANDSDSVHCVVRNPLGSSVTSKMARLTVSSATQILKIIREPESSVNISVGGSLSLQVDAQGSGTISYTWYKNGLAATDSVGTGKKYYKTSVSASDSGVYRCVAKNSFGLDTSVAVTVKVTTETPVKLINPITIECTYTAQTDTVNVSLKKIPSGTVRDSIVSMLLFYGSETFGFVWDTVPVAEFPLADSLFIVYKNEKFLSDQQTITVNVFLRGINSMLSDTVSKTLQVGINRPQNTIALSVKEAHERSIDLEWTMINESADSIRIWTGKEPVPLTFNPNSLQYTPLTVGGGIRSLSVENLDTNTHYYFAAQIKKDVLWSTITATSRTDKFTLGSADTRKVQNAIKVINTSFDTIANALSVRWSVDSTGISGFNLQAAVCFSVLTYPLAGPGLGDSIIESVNLHYENVTTIPWIGSKIFDTTYYISMFLRNKTASWSDTAAAAQDTIFIPKAKKESVTLFKVDGDSVYALNRTILIRKGKNWSPTSIVITNEIRLDTVPGTTNGFITVSSPFRFEKGEQTSDIEIGMRYNTLPGEFSANDVYMYVYKNGNWRLLNRIAVDADARMIFANFPIGDATDIMLPHLLMIDIAAPRVVLSDSNEAIEPNEDYVCPISVADNIANAVCTLKCGMINKPLEVVKIIPLTDTTFGGFLSISSSEFPIKSENSFRILLTVTDHHNSKVYDLSKQVVKSDNVVTYSDMTWVPVSTTAILNKPSMDQAFKEICDGNEWKYDSLKFRIFKWHTSVNSAKDGYIEYSGDRPDIFDVVPGKVFWLKKRGGGTFNLGDGKTVSISDPFKITLPAQQWTDFAMPYDIQLSLADIFNTSGIGPEEQKTIWFFKFDASISGKQAVLSPVYYPVLGDNGPISDIVLSQGSYTAYTIYNSTQTEQVLTIPPIDKSYSTITSSVLAKKADDDNWYIKIESSSKGDISAPVYCVFKKYGSGISKYPSPPYPGSVRVGILDSIERKTYGTIVLNDDRMGYSVPLYITNSSKTESKTVTYSLSSSKPGKSGNLAVYNAETGKLESGSGSCSSYSVYLEPQGHAYRWALAGDSAYFSTWMKNFPNVQFGLTKIIRVAGGVLGIEYTVPFSGINAVKVMIINQLGQSVWSNTNRNLVPGKVNTTNWNIKTSGRLASGAYIIQVSSYNAVNKQVNRVQKRYLHVVR